MTAPAQPSLYSRVERHLSPQRMAPFLAAASGNQQQAVALYVWNLTMSGATYEALHIFEVAIRNAIDPALRRWNATQRDSTGRPHGVDWLSDPSRLLERLVGRDDLDLAYSRAKRARGGKKPGHDDVLAQMSMSTWRFLLPDNDSGRQYLWTNALYASFPHWNDAPEDLTVAVAGVLDIRNRVAHLEPLLNITKVRAQFDNMRAVLSAIDPDIEQWFVSNQRVTALMKDRAKHQHSTQS